jgi:hypothetical protein
LLVGTSSPSQAATLTNNGTTSLNILSIATSGPYSQTNDCGTLLPAAASCKVNVVYTATAAGTQNGTLSVNDGTTQTTSLAGTGTVITFSPTSLSFGNQARGTSSSPQSVTVKNIGSALVSINKIAVTGTEATSFSQTNNCGSSLAGGATCSIAVTFTPQSTGALNATVELSDSGGDSPQAIPISGTGT